MRYRYAKKFIPTLPPVLGYRNKAAWKAGQTPPTKPLTAQAKVRQKWFEFYFSHNRNASLTCRHFGISRKTFYKWLDRYDSEGLEGLGDRSRAPCRKRKKMIDLEAERRIINLRKKYIRYGKEKLAVIYQKVYGEKVSRWHIQCTIEDHELYYHPINHEKEMHRRRLGQKKKRITQLERKEKKGFFFQLDTKVMWWNSQKRYIFTAVEKDYKLAYAWMHTSASSLKAADFLARLNHLVDSKIELLQTDNGSEFAKNFEKACQVLKIDHYFSRVKTPKDNAGVERFHRTLKDEFIQLGNFSPFPEVFNPLLTEWLIEYNFNRPHQSLGYVSPVELLEMHKKVLPMWSSHTLH